MNLYIYIYIYFISFGQLYVCIVTLDTCIYMYLYIYRLGYIIYIYICIYTPHIYNKSLAKSLFIYLFTYLQRVISSILSLSFSFFRKDKKRLTGIHATLLRPICDSRNFARPVGFVITSIKRSFRI